MILPDEFDAFYKRARTRLLLQTYALTGDLPAARSAVRDSFVVTWHHWRKVNRLADPESWVRPRAWSQAQRRHNARIWHRDRHLDPGAKATLAALGKLSFTQRRAFVLDQLTDLQPADRARELGLPRAEADQVAEAATDRFLTHRDVAADRIPALLSDLGEQTAGTTWPRASIVRRSGAARRRTHTLVGVVAAVVAVVATGTVVSGAPAADSGDPAGTDRSTSVVEEEPGESEVPTFDAGRLLTSEAVSLVLDGHGWHERRTSDNARGDGLATPCQQARYADARGLAALVRTFATKPRRNDPEVAAVQVAELSRGVRASERTWRRTLSWYAGCVSGPRVQLLGTHEVKRVGDQAMLFHLRSWRGPGRTYLAGVARTGAITTTTFMQTTAGNPDLQGAARLLSRAVNQLCVTDAGTTCATGTPRTVAVPPVEVGEVPGLLLTVDLPPVPGVDRPWVGTEPTRARQNVASTRCDHADFSGKPMSNAVTRTFLIPGSRLPTAFGLTETVGTLPGNRAREFVDTVRDRMRSCPDRDPGTEVTSLGSVGHGNRHLASWRVTSELDDDRTVTYLMGVIRVGTAVGQVGFVPGGGATLTPDDFDALVSRAADRLAYMPRPDR